MIVRIAKPSRRYAPTISFCGLARIALGAPRPSRSQASHRDFFAGSGMVVKSGAGAGAGATGAGFGATGYVAGVAGNAPAWYGVAGATAGQAATGAGAGAAVGHAATGICAATVWMGCATA